ncbi:MAG: precorrin-3B synthase [Paracoccaceae bacterium]|nr:MAG: precorrin-3B synthase [Paracoccaceae bacterium]
MTAAPEIRGWCPGALRPMLSGDGWVVRVRPPMGRLERHQAAGLAALSARHGNGLIDLSNRANLQLRGVTDDSHAPLIAGLRGLGLVDDDAGTEARRNLVVSPFWQAGDGTEQIAAELAAALAGRDAPQLPGKFGFALDTGPARVLAEVSADIFITRTGDDAFAVHPCGAVRGAPCNAAGAAALAMRLARWFLETGGAPAGRGRMASHLPLAALPEGFASVPLPRPVAQPGPGLRPEGALAGLAFGQMEASTLAALASCGPLRLTPWRMVLVEGAQGMPDRPGLICDPFDPLLRVVACTGAPGCPQGHAPTRPLARSLAARVPPGGLLHVSGCAKGCAHPGPAPVTLTATPEGFCLVRNGTAAATGPIFTQSDLMADDAPHL